MQAYGAYHCTCAEQCLFMGPVYGACLWESWPSGNQQGQYLHRSPGQMTGAHCPDQGEAENQTKAGQCFYVSALPCYFQYFS